MDLDIVKKYLKKAKISIEAAEYLIKGSYFEDSAQRCYVSMLYAIKALLNSKDVGVKNNSDLIHKFADTFIETNEFHEDYYAYLLEGASLRLLEDEIEISPEEDVDVNKAIKFIVYAKDLLDAVIAYINKNL